MDTPAIASLLSGVITRRDAGTGARVGDSLRHTASAVVWSMISSYSMGVNRTFSSPLQLRGSLEEPVPSPRTALGSRPDGAGPPAPAMNGEGR